VTKWNTYRTELQLPIIRGFRSRLRLFWDIVIKQKRAYISLEFQGNGSIGNVKLIVESLIEE